jgi:tetratricopeptide (TPR) repeat protein
MAASGQEYYSLGMAYFDLGKYDEAEKWLNRARMADRTMVASEYNLGRIAFETKRYNDAARNFENVLKKDPNNVLALKAAAYTRIKTGDLDLAEKHYNKLLTLVPESTDDGYNYALVLYAMERYEDAERVLAGYPFALLDNNDTILLHARSQKEQNKAEAIDGYAKWLEVNNDPKVRYEYAQLLENHELYARALEEYQTCLSSLTQSSDLQRSDIQFAIAALLLIADSESEQGIAELETAIRQGYENIEAVEDLQNNLKVSETNREKLESIINEMRQNASKTDSEGGSQSSGN